MSVIAHWIEQRGISTVVVGLVKPHLEKIRPPRALWVPFELGRPMGPPGNAGFQQRVLTAALEMVAHATDEPMLNTFTDDDPRSTPQTDWQAPAMKHCESVREEMQALLEAQKKFSLDHHHRTSVGVAKIDLSACAAFIDSLKTDEVPTQSPRADISPVLMTRYAIDDLKAWYIEAALSTGAPSSRQVLNWFWQETTFGMELLRLRKVWMKSDNNKLSTLGERFLAPHRWRVP